MKGVVRVDAEFEDFDAYADFLHQSPNDIEVHRLKGSHFSARLSSISNADVTVTVARTAGPLIRRGAMDSHQWNFGFTPGALRPMHWCGHEGTGHSEIGMFPKEYVNISKSGLDAYGVSIADEYFEEVAAGEECRMNARAKKRFYGQVMKIGEEEINCLQHTVEMTLSNPAGTIGDSLHGLARLFVLIIAGEPRTRRSNPSNRRRTYERAQEYMRAYVGEEICLEDVSHNVGASTRTLAYAFREHAGMTPMHFLKNTRLNDARSLLRYSSPDDDMGVADVATSCGFWHLSRFAADYRNLFGCLPSDDLKARPAPW